MDTICCDVDGTLTEFESFVLKYGPIFLRKFYHIDDLTINFEGYDLDEVFIDQKLAEYFEKVLGISADEILKKFWNVFYPMYIAKPVNLKRVEEIVNKFLK